MATKRQRVSECTVVFIMILLIYGGISFADIGSCNEVLDCMSNSTITGNLTVTGNITGNLIYGEIWFHDDGVNGVSTTIDTAGVWYNITGFASGESDEIGQTLNGFTYEQGNTLAAQIAGLYKVDYSISFEKSSGGGSKKEYMTRVSVNGVTQNSTETHRSLTSATAVGNTGGSGFLSLSANDQVTLMIRAVDGTDNVGIHAANLNLMRVGD